MTPNVTERRGWRRETVSLMFLAGREDRTGYVHPSAPGLAVTEHHDGYSVSHLSSGLLVTANGVPSVPLSLADAKAILFQLAALGDWTRTSQAIRDDQPFRAAVRGILMALSEASHAA